MSYPAKVIVPGIHQLGQRNAWETGSRTITVEEAQQIANRVCSLPVGELFAAAKKEIAALTAR